MCVFCKIVSGEIPCYKLYEDELILIFLDINPDSCGHSLIIPKKHYTDLNDIEENVLNHIMQTSKKLKTFLENNLNCDGITLIQNNGEIQDVKHYHLHFKPFYKTKKDLTLNEVYNLLKEKSI